MALPIDLYANEMITACKEAGIGIEPLRSICQHESSGDPYAVRYEPVFKWTCQIDRFAKSLHISSATEEQLQKMSWGLPQIMGGTARGLGFAKALPILCEPLEALRLAAKFVAVLGKKYAGDVQDIIAAYNAGSVRKNEDGTYVNQAYVDSVNQFLYKN